MTLTSYLLAAIAALPVFREDVGEGFAAQKSAQAQMIATAITESVARARGWPGSERDLAALMLTVAWHETRLSLRIHDGRCRPFECDHGRARGLWQLHVQRSLPRERWLQTAGLSLEATRSAAVEAARTLIRSRRMCSIATRGGDWVGATLASYAGVGCGGRLPDLPARIRTFQRLSRLEPKPGSV